jgi:hypothetical protein
MEEMTREHDTNSGKESTALWWKAAVLVAGVAFCFACREDGYYKGRSGAAKTCMKAIVKLCDEDGWQLGGCKCVNDEMKKMLSGEEL